MLLDIAILSYNRTFELTRCLDSLKRIDHKYVNDIRVIVYEDCSPNQSAIKKICTNYISDTPFSINFNPSLKNLGYDLNLLRALQSDSTFTLLLSDDDFIDPNYIEELLLFLNSFDGNLLISSFKKNNDTYRPGVHYKGVYSQHVLYDSILFSGLIFRNSVVNLDKDEIHFLSTSIYTQVYLVSKYWCPSSCYFSYPFIIAGEDGENYFGKSESSLSQSDLSDRSAYDSNLAYQERFQNVALSSISKFHNSIKRPFLHSYSFRLVSHFFRVKINNPKFFWKSFFTLPHRNLIYFFYVYPIILFIGILPSMFCHNIYKFCISKFRVSGG